MPCVTSLFASVSGTTYSKHHVIWLIVSHHETFQLRNVVLKVIRGIFRSDHFLSVGEIPVPWLASSRLKTVRSTTVLLLCDTSVEIDENYARSRTS